MQPQLYYYISITALFKNSLVPISLLIPSPITQLRYLYKMRAWQYFGEKSTNNIVYQNHQPRQNPGSCFRTVTSILHIIVTIAPPAILDQLYSMKVKYLQQTKIWMNTINNTRQKKPSTQVYTLLNSIYIEF